MPGLKFIFFCVIVALSHIALLMNKAKIRSVITRRIVLERMPSPGWSCHVMLATHIPLWGEHYVYTLNCGIFCVSNYWNEGCYACYVKYVTRAALKAAPSGG